MDKSEFIKSLQKVKIVIGNGFDLYCGLKTKYKDYFDHNKDKYCFINDKYREYLDMSIVDFDFTDKRINLLNSWDLFFALNSLDNNQMFDSDWCDIERLMLSSFPVHVNNNERNTITSKIDWGVMKGRVSKDEHRKCCDIYDFIAVFMKTKIKYLQTDLESFYDFLLSELKAFEKNFGNYIHNQIVPNTPERNFIDTTNRTYFQKAEATINELCDINNLVAIDTFNYSDMRIENLKCPIQHINGSYLNPIFGIDSSFEPKDECFIFTKTARRIDSDMFEQSFERKPDFENVVIFGHSLNEADYSYFFPLFDKLNLLDSLANNVVVFAYSIYDEKQEKTIKSTLRKSISNIMFAYAKSKGVSEPQRFLDSLSTQNRIVTYELPAELEINKIFRK